MLSMAIASIAAWFTPTVLFCSTNLIIATIFIASNNTNNNNNNNHHNNNNNNNIHHDNPPTRNISRVSSFLERARSMKFTSYESVSEPTTATFSSSSPLAQSIHDEPLSQPAHSPSFFQRVTSFKFSESDSNSPGHELARSPSIIERVKSFKLSSAFDFGATSSSSSTEPEIKNLEHPLII
ncbi:uncharacterized protein LOC143555226 [Bidens hawaiensis]|uniref:uncharacterized protein LOC143555226 n=1 Tax=Bidens hawaiensis TaxID=980011 RepID=UPI00404B1E80